MSLLLKDDLKSKIGLNKNRGKNADKCFVSFKFPCKKSIVLYREPKYNR